MAALGRLAVNCLAPVVLSEAPVIVAWTYDYQVTNE